MHQALFDVLKSTARVSTFSELAKQCLPVMADAIGGAETGLYVYQGAKPTFFGGTLIEPFQGYAEHYFTHDVIHQELAGVPHGSFIVRGEYLDLQGAGFFGTSVFADFYTKNGFQQMLGLWPDQRPYGTEGMIGVYLTRSGPAFDPQAVACLQQAEHFLRAAFDRCRQWERFQHDTRTTTHAAPHLVWDANGTLECVARTAKWLLPRGRVPAEFSTAAQAYARCLQNGEIPPCQRTSVPVSGHCRIEVSFFPYKEHSDAGGVAGLLRVRLGSNTHALTKAEWAVLGQLACGLSNGDIGKRLFLSEATVRTHVRQILKKLNVSSRAQAAIVGFARLGTTAFNEDFLHGAF